MVRLHKDDSLEIERIMKAHGISAHLYYKKYITKEEYAKMVESHKEELIELVDGGE